ncbi:hypothetical protein AB4455_22715 [Vibrio sp. 10N.261.46.E12]|uniref:hypothetical protein n=1 Tax=unclassified Vibrio TaxID=2614977 RepID=UPI00097667AF|nr:MULTISPECIES: hypothetical protein [unclassified Vibrio]OMO35814.1 hypothetical protein BH584_06915 [Vibrio sp. 10N.261.45.E1]PMJ34955.1 hypothetical protein BCU27_24520 [Vibrio sp. 10N.286.45.B6]PML86969.1 hypothetical protein BCT66_12990 [Vibrio sp. 10N.261.49.E11]PMM75130.1 hypothetical protein BCT48_25480 [Vibrio sp. 10N.261.46.F12]PMM85746.1 hypothetical protein BCT46_08770 [Vibrio sp. 10N.261.46.E8]
MTTATLTQDMAWKFKLGKTFIDFPNPLASLDDNARALAQHFPQLRWTRVFEEDAQYDADQNAMVVPIIAPPVKTNG